MASRKALPVSSSVPATGRRPKSSTMASAAPKLAAEEIPSVNGSASGLSSRVCISAPATARLAPTMIAIKATGSRISHTTIWRTRDTSDGATNAFSTSGRA